MDKPHLLVISTRLDDTVFFANLAHRLKIDCTTLRSAEGLVIFLKYFRNSIVIWDIDGPEGSSADQKNQYFSSVRTILENYLPSSRVFAISDQSLNRAQIALAGVPIFQHHIIRHLDTPAELMMEKLISAAFNPNILGLKHFFPAQAPTQKLTLKKASHRAAAVNAIEAFFEKMGVKARLASRVAQATDELLMNAIFNAPHNKQGQPIRRLLKRSSEVEFGKNDVVKLETMATEEYFGVCVTDLYGTLTRDIVFRLLSKNYRSNEYTPPSDQPGAGLGINGIVEMGLSYAVICKPGVRTDAMIFFPRTQNHKKFRESFQFISYL